MRVLVAVGGNALIRRGERADARTQRANVQDAAHSLASLAHNNELIITHGNGPQVGLLALQAEAYKDVAPYPLDVLGAESEGMIGYLLDQALVSELPGRQVATLLTQVEVDPQDPAFAAPTKPIGPLYREEDARRIASERGWNVAADGPGYRRVVASPEPKRILELETIRLLVEAGVIVVCSGGGGIPVRIDEGFVRGVEAVIDKDLTAALLATRLEADTLLMLTDVEAVYHDWGTASAQPLRQVRAGEIDSLRLAPGSMGPKGEAARRFVSATGRPAYIGALSDGLAILLGEAGTRIDP